MSKVKSPQLKKQLSLARDRRNTYGENAKASRKGISRSKARLLRVERRRVGQVLSRSLSGEDPLIAECAAREIGALKARSRFVKTPDEPLGTVIAAKRARRVWRAQRSTKQ
ncbi:MAG: hypothetical protein KDI71_09460 [Xanthomonadales bacterium]|nr:hypothetical protein [Xanthomonadales bacterium]